MGRADDWRGTSDTEVSIGEFPSTDRFEIPTLAQIAGIGDHIHVILFVDPLDGHRCVESTAVS